MRPALVLYRGAQHLARALTPLVAHGSGKVARGLRGRRRAHADLVAWGRAHRAPDRPLVWFHAPSVGEGLQARAVLEALSARRADLQTVFTHFSPSAEALAGRMPADVAGYLPWDLPGTVGPVLEAVRPDLLVFTKTEAWPVLVAEAASRGVRVAMAAGTLPESAGRRGGLARRVLEPRWRRLELLAAISPEDGARFVDLGVAAGAIRVAGDPGIDSAAQRAAGARPEAPYLAPFEAVPRPTLVAGSTWPADEAVLLPALERVRQKVDGFRVVLAPHEPDAAHVDGLLTRLDAGGWRAATLSRVEVEGAGEVDAVVVDRVGVLAHLYTAGSVAYVGGGFHGQGLHSVLEPAAARRPVCFGPRHANARAAGDLVSHGGAVEVRDAEDLARIVLSWFTDPEAHDYAAARAYDYIDAHRGAAERTAVLLDALLPPVDPRPAP
ncbi:MAG: glycosyltransferase N-terminal domain-containing protein [Longimicrobiales bacterium]